MIPMSATEERTWHTIVKNPDAPAVEIAEAAQVSADFAQNLINRIGSDHPHKTDQPVRDRNVGTSDYAKHKIQPWDIWLEYNLNPWDADIIKRVLREKPGQRRLDYQKIMHVCEERIRQLDAEAANLGGES